MLRMVPFGPLRAIATDSVYFLLDNLTLYLMPEKQCKRTEGSCTVIALCQFFIIHILTLN